MKKMFPIALVAISLFAQLTLESHCQMPCGIYHDDMVYDQIDQYVETMYKGLTVITDSKFANANERNQAVRWIIQKETASDEVAHIITTYFLQQKIKPGEPDTAKRLESAHKLLFMAVLIKQGTDRQLIEDFADEWDKFKLMFHVEGYECQIELLKIRKREQLEKQLKEKEAKEKAPDTNGNNNKTPKK